LLGKMGGFGFELRSEAHLKTLAEDVGGLGHQP
jgi:hypothetical protein